MTVARVFWHQGPNVRHRTRLYSSRCKRRSPLEIDLTIDGRRQQRNGSIHCGSVGLIGNKRGTTAVSIKSEIMLPTTSEDIHLIKAPSKGSSINSVGRVRRIVEPMSTSAHCRPARRRASRCHSGFAQGNTRHCLGPCSSLKTSDLRQTSGSPLASPRWVRLLKTVFDRNAP
jgi:hypothetical protein